MKREVHLLKFGRAVRKLREEKAWSQEELAERADLHRNYVSSCERGERNISLENIIKIAHALTCRASDLLRAAGL